MALNSTSSVEDVLAAYADNSGFDINNSVAEAKLFVQACRILIVKMPKMATQDRASLSLSPELVQAELKRALLFVSGSSDPTAIDQTGGGSRFYSFNNLRDEGFGHGCGGNGGCC